MHADIGAWICRLKFISGIYRKIHQQPKTRGYLISLHIQWNPDLSNPRVFEPPGFS